MVDHQQRQPSPFLSSNQRLPSAQPHSLTPSSTAATATSQTTDTNTNHHHLGRPSTPSRFLSVSSPLPPASSAYALVSLTRNLGTPTSDLRATSPSSNLNYPADSDHALNPPSSADSSSSPADWPQQQQHHHHHQNSTDDIFQLPHLGSDYLKPTAQLPGVQNLLDNNHSHSSSSSCFWAILDDQLKLAFIDPFFLPNSSRFHHQSTDNNLSLDQLIHPLDFENLKRDLIKLSPRLPIGSDRSTASETTIVGHSQSSCRTPIRCRFVRNAQLDRSLGLGTTENSSSYSTESDDRYQPTDLLLHPIPLGRFLAFFHPQQQAPRPESHGNHPYSPWITSTTHLTPTSACGPKELESESNYLSREEVNLLHRALGDSSSHSPAFQPQPSSLERPSTIAKQPDPLLVFLIINSRNAQVLFSHHSLPQAGSVADYLFCPEDYAYFAMQSKQQKLAEISSGNEEKPGQTDCARELTAQHRLVKDGTVINIVQSFVIEYGSVTFASFKSSLPPSSRPQAMINQQQPNATLANVKPSPLELVHDQRSMPLDLYSPTSSQLAHPQKRTRTDSCSEVLTPQSACSTQSQPYSYQRPSTHPGHQYSSFNSHHHHHHHHHPSPQLSSLTSSISMPESPDPYGSQYPHFSGELSPTMASAANVLGSFHRAHYHHPQSMLALQDAHHHHQISPPASAHPSMIGFDSYGLQNLASMAASAPFDPPPPPPDFSPGSNLSSPHQSGHESYGLGSGSSTMNVHRSFRPSSSSSKDGHNSRLNQSPANPTSAEANEGILCMGLNRTTEYGHHQHQHHPHSPEVMTGGYRTSSHNRDTRNPSLTAFHDSRVIGIKRSRPTALDGSLPTGNNNNNLSGLIDPGSSSTSTVRSCTSCGAQNSPEWRKGPNGVKSLCNACGLRFSRAQARKSKAPKNNGSGNNGGGNNFKKNAPTSTGPGQQSNLGKKKPGPNLVAHPTHYSTEDPRLVVDGFRG
ncbi:hypothetical protein Pst134EA_015172 [Puccinia striiformis f. sp. tritici]|uniref:hypothetical protein n=1 Tax=Puccinia striiformis f. sp. tritici TaxID=168172 RepID=UPI002007C803|nr:hypothetical protein Pst134EA_015172 [Puccinia striiformis f. sp. tritici]KAH9463086.1 hypothetical protein Pst134EA_015172 [Puccinia striiformis f. sp. tritici]KAI9609822.1 hypothetical protein KEM48_002687 [Puccinia striiformis f. sp. tritici PST-130]